MPTIRASLAPMARKQLNGFATIFSLQFQNACTLNFFGRYIYIYIYIYIQGKTKGRVAYS